MKNQNKIALVTGANSGIGFETAAQLAEDGYGKVILACRTLTKADAAKALLIERTGKDVFDTLAVDVSEPKTVHIACDTLLDRNDKIDILILNAGMSSGTEPAYNSDGIELTFASTIIGHHVMAIRLLNDKLLSEHGRIVIAGSEGARGDVPGMNIPDFPGFAAKHFNSDLENMLETIARVQAPYKFNSMSTYVTAKVYVAWWAAALSRRLPAGITVNAVSPGSVPTTNFARHQNWMMQKVMIPMMNSVGRLFGMAGPISAAARRYIDAAGFNDDTTGQFFASPKGKMIGDLVVQTTPHFLSETSQEACWNVLVRLTNGADYSVATAA
jgi:NAD(P)-dependent dehydrogenase (short-subunit alcohol dehydrogenase family)